MKYVRVALTKREAENLLYIAAMRSSSEQEQREVFGSGRDATENFKAWQRACGKLREATYRNPRAAQ
jgi:hypothetical protein